MRRAVIVGVAGVALAGLLAPVVVLAALTGIGSSVASSDQCHPNGAATPADLASFLAAIRQHESHGDYTAHNPGSSASGAYQFLTSTWASQATAAGYSQWAGGPAAAAPPQVQDAVAAAMATGIYNADPAHSWLDVAAAWFIGHIPTPGELDVAPPGNNGLTPRAYEAQIAALMAGGTTPGAVCPSTDPSGYVNPFGNPAWGPARTDQGVDWIPSVPLPVYAIGPGVITYSSTTSGWPGGAFLIYQLTGGSHAGLFVYVAEHLTNLAPVGTVVAAGDTLAVALPGYPWTEWGWAGSCCIDIPSSPYNGAADGTPTDGGQAFARFLVELGAKPLQDPGPGADRP